VVVSNRYKSTTVFMTSVSDTQKSWITESNCTYHPFL